jgi:hypothetical protein
MKVVLNMIKAIVAMGLILWIGYMLGLKLIENGTI